MSNMFLAVKSQFSGLMLTGLGLEFSSANTGIALPAGVHFGDQTVSWGEIKRWPRDLGALFITRACS